jgi:LysR family hydrogen peroxide-inducible transcriptional activator
MEFHEIRYFLALSQTLNFTKAAEACHVSQPALTRAIRKMEAELGGLLFSRDHSNVRLTDLGQLVEPGLSEAIQRAGDAKKAASRFLRLEQADMVLGVMCTIAPVRFVGFLGKFRADHPGVALTLKESVPERLCELLLEGELDVALMARPTGFDAPLQATELYTEPFVIACSAGHAFAAKREVAIADLDGENYLSRISCEFIDVLGELCRSRGVNLVRSYRSEREDWILNMVAAGRSRLVTVAERFSVIHRSRFLHHDATPTLPRQAFINGHSAPAEHTTINGNVATDMPLTYAALPGPAPCANAVPTKPAPGPSA